MNGDGAPIFGGGGERDEPPGGGGSGERDEPPEGPGGIGGAIRYLADTWRDVKEGEGDYDERGRSIDVSVDVKYDDDHEATPDDPLNPSYSMTLRADAETPGEAADYLDDVFDDLGAGDRLVVEGFDWLEGDRETLVDRAWTDVKDEFQRGTTTAKFPVINRLAGADWGIESEGLYSISATIERADGPGYAGHSDSFRVSGPEIEGPHGLSLSVTSQEESGLVTGLNRAAEPGYMVVLDAGDMSERQYRQSAIEYLRNDFEGLQVEWGEAEDIVELADGLFPVMGETQSDVWRGSPPPDGYFDGHELDDAYIEQGWLYHPGINRFIRPSPVPLSYEDGEQLGLRVSALDDLDAGESPGYDHTAWTDVEDFGWLDFAGAVLGGIGWLDRGMPLGDVEEPAEEAEEKASGWERTKESFKQRYLMDVPDHLITDWLEEHTFIGKYVGRG